MSGLKLNVAKCRLKIASSIKVKFIVAFQCLKLEHFLFIQALIFCIKIIPFSSETNEQLRFLNVLTEYALTKFLSPYGAL